VLLARDVWTAPVQDYDTLMGDPQLRHNGLLWDVPVGAGSPGFAAETTPTFRTVGSPIRMSRTPARVRRGVPHLGEHTTDVMGAGAPARDFRPDDRRP
jgi:crotonobetainyl-CoA:carnitine CoA-transferase CaiB-like acyl-CoA transferase